MNRVRVIQRAFSEARPRSSLRDAYIISAVRTPIGSFQGSLKTLDGPSLGAIAAKEAVKRSGISPEAVEEAYLGNVLQANQGQAPARQAVLKAGLPDTTEATTIHKVCASGLKTVALAAQAIQVGDKDVILAGGFESMSNAPFYVKRGLSFGNATLSDAIVRDGLWDVYNDIHMGNCCENTNKREGITREQQDEYAINSFKKASAAQEAGGFDAEIVPVTIKSKKGEVIVKDDESVKAVKYDAIPKLRPAFQEDGTVTAANASSLNDGAAALIVASQDAIDQHGVKPLAKIIAYADAATAPIDFTIAPSLAIPKLLKKAGLTKDDIAKWEINEAFAGVYLANNKILGLDASKVNVKGGAVALGHPIGASGARILVTLVNNLKEGEYGVAAICNGGGAATSLLIKKL